MNATSLDRDVKVDRAADSLAAVIRGDEVEDEPSIVKGMVAVDKPFDVALSIRAVRAVESS